MNSTIRNLLVRMPALVGSYTVYKYYSRLRNKYLPAMRYFFHRSETVSIDPSRRAIVFSPTVNPPIALVFEALFAAKLRQRGMDAKVLYDNGLFAYPDSVSVDDLIRRRDFWRMMALTRKVVSRFPKYLFTHAIPGRDEHRRVKELAREMLQRNSYVMEGIDLWPFIEASLVRYTKTALGFWSGSEGADKMKALFCRNAIWSLMIGRGIARDIKPELVVMSHGIYSTWGPLYQYLKQQGIKVVLYDFGWYKPDGMIFNHSGLIANGSDDGFFAARHQDIDIRKALEFVDEFIEKRFNGFSFDIDKARPLNTTDFSLETLLARAAGRKLYALFPNVLWDASNADTDSYFENWVEWITESVGYFMGCEDKTLIIRAHPSEKEYMKARITVEDVITKTFGKAVDQIPNLIFIPPNARFSSYELFPHIEAGLVYNGTLGLEMIYKDIPVFVAGKAPYQEHDFVARFRDKEDYFQSLDKPESVLAVQKPNRDLLIKYLYTYFWVNQASIRFMTSFRHLPNLKLLEEVWNDKQLDFASDAALGEHQFFQDWIFD